MSGLATVSRLAFGRLVSLSGGSAAYIALVSAIYGETRSALWISAAVFSSVVGSVLAAPLAGWVGDRFDRRRVMIASDAAATVVALAMAGWVDHPVALAILLGASSVAQAPFEPASAAALPAVVGAGQVARANALVAATASAAYLVGPLLGGAALALGASPAAVFLFDAGTFVLSAVVVASVRGSFGRGSTEESPGPLAGARLVLADSALYVPVVAGIVSLLGIGIVDVASYPLSRHLGSGAGGYGAMTALLGGGGLLGVGVAGLIAQRRQAFVLAAAFVVSAAGFALAGSAPVLVIALVGMALAGSGRGIGDVTSVTLIQARAPDAVRSRVFATQEGAAHIAFSISAFSGGLLVSLAGSRAAFAAAAALAVCAALIAGRADGPTRPGEL
jgi:MFS family permease